MMFAWLLVIAVLLGGLAWVTRETWLPWSYEWLDVTEAPRQADFIVVLGGGDGSRAATAAGLYLQGYARRVIVSGCIPGTLESDLEILAEAGIPADAIITLQDAESTWEEARQVFDVLHAEQVSSALVVTEAFHSRRAWATYRHRQSDPTIELTFIDAPRDFSAENWWRDKSGWPLTRAEFVKLAYYLFRYGVLPI
jgi:uncharacterized SAM-binding protein YcdF (DUF218 family)